MSLPVSVESSVPSTVLNTATEIHLWNKWMNQETNYTSYAYANPKKITFRVDRIYKLFTRNSFFMIIYISLYFNALVWPDLGVTSEVLWSLEISVMSIDICPTNGNNFSALFPVQGDLSKVCCLFQRKTATSIETALLKFRLLANQKKKNDDSEYVGRFEPLRWIPNFFSLLECNRLTRL